jgi:hypothetical protein
VRAGVDQHLAEPIGAVLADVVGGPDHEPGVLVGPDHGRIRAQVAQPERERRRRERARHRSARPGQRIDALPSQGEVLDVAAAAAGCAGATGCDHQERDG